jgi:hypothetical protein
VSVGHVAFFLTGCFALSTRLAIDLCWFGFGVGTVVVVVGTLVENSINGSFRSGKTGCNRLKARCS